MKYVSVVVPFSAALNACSPGSHKDMDSVRPVDIDRLITDSLIQSDINSQSIETIGKGWEYSLDKNEAKGTVLRVAETDAIPHGKQIISYGISSPSLLIRDSSASGLDIFIVASEGHFLCGAAKVGYVFVSFDDKPDSRWRCSQSAGSSNVVFITNPKPFLSRILSSSSFIFKADMVGHTKSDYKFDVRELEWPIDSRRAKRRNV